ncbi:MAG: hypothetical protein ACLFR1_05765 [Spirochaetia bacterium]
MNVNTVWKIIFPLVIACICGCASSPDSNSSGNNGQQNQLPSGARIISSEPSPAPDWAVNTAAETRAYELATRNIAYYIATRDWRYREDAETQHTQYTIYEIIADQLLEAVIEEYGTPQQEIPERRLHYIRYLTAQAVTEHARQEGECLLHIEAAEGRELFRKVFFYSIERSVIDHILTNI